MVDTIEIQPEEQVDPTLAALEAEKSKETTDNTESSQNDNLILGKYKTQKDLENAYLSLNREYSKVKSTGRTDEKSPETAPSQESDEVSPPTNIEETVPDYAKYSQELNDNGELSEASYESLDKQGLSKDMVDAYIAGQQALQQKAWDSMAEHVGGMDNLKDMASWANETFSDTDVTTLNRVLNGSQYEQQMALTDLKARYQQANGEPSLIQGKAGSSNVVGFQSLQQLSEAQKDPRYKNDPAYRHEVERRLSVSNL